VRSDAVQVAATPALDGLCASGSCSFAATTQLGAPTVSSPGWTSVLTGVDPQRHGVMNNGMFDAFEPGFPTFLKVARDAGFRTAAACDWEELCLALLIPEGGLDVVTDAADLDSEGTATAAEADLMGESDVVFVHIDLPDHAGHSTGFSPDNADYITAIEQSDTILGRLLAAIEARPTRVAEDWLVVVTTDHGGSGTSHGAVNAENRTIFLALGGDIDGGGTLPGASHQDVHPTVLTWLGQEPAPGLDGVVQEVEPPGE
jgi:predicted AlkP superfamily pyrophosphatase or phosphodiesterase